MLAEIDQVDAIDSRAAVDAATTICPPWPAAMIRAARFNAGPK